MTSDESDQPTDPDGDHPASVEEEAHPVRHLDPEVQARKLVEVLTLAEALPYRPRPLATARWK